MKNSSRLSSYLSACSLVPFFIALALVLFCAMLNRFTQDDAFITFNYVKWALRGYGLVWYPGSSEFGYTNFLYAVVLWFGSSFGLEVYHTSDVIGISSLVTSFLLTYFFLKKTLDTAWYALLFSTAIFTHFTS